MEKILPYSSRMRGGRMTDKDHFLKLWTTMGFLSVIILLPFQIYIELFGQLSITLAFIMSVSLYFPVVLLKRSIGKIFFIEHPLNWVIFAFFLSMVLSNLDANSVTVSAKFTLKWIAMLSAIFPLFWSFHFLKRKDDFFSFLSISATLTTLIGIFFYILGPMALKEFFLSRAAGLFFDPSTLRYGDINWFRGGGTGGTFFNRNWYAAFLGMAIPYSVVRTIFVPKFRIYWGSMSVLMILGLLISLSRGGWLGFIAFTIFLVFIYQKNFVRIVIFGLLFTIVATLVIMAFFPDLGYMLFERAATIMIVDYRINRLVIWSDSLNSMPRNPVFGIGIANNPIGSAHSNYLQVLVEQGIFGLMVFVSLLTLVFQGLYNKLKKLHDDMRRLTVIGVMGSWIWFCVQGFLSTTLFNDKNFMTFVAFLAVTMYILQDPGEEG